MKKLFMRKLFTTKLSMTKLLLTKLVRALSDETCDLVGLVLSSVFLAWTRHGSFPAWRCF
jgi:hypothetical protein